MTQQLRSLPLAYYLAWIRATPVVKDGVVAGSALIIFGLASALLALFRADQPHPAFSVSLSVIAVLAGAALWLDRRNKARGYTSTDDSSAP